jgi:hypothetical protein
LRGPEYPEAACPRQKPSRCSTLTTACRGRRSQRPPPAEHSSPSGRPSLSPEVESPLLHQSDADDVCVHGGALRPSLAGGAESCRAVEASSRSIHRTAKARRSIILRLSSPLARLFIRFMANPTAEGVIWGSGTQSATRNALFMLGLFQNSQSRFLPGKARFCVLGVLGKKFGIAPSVINHVPYPFPEPLLLSALDCPALVCPFPRLFCSASVTTRGAIRRRASSSTRRTYAQ